MENVEARFIGILSDFLHGEPSDSIEDCNYYAILDLARKHQVEGILYYQLKAFWNKEYTETEIAKKLKSNFSAATYYYVNRCRELENIASIFKQKNIKFITVKGADIASLYPVPALRTMGDIDIVVLGDDRNRADLVMKKLGYIADTQPGREWGYSKSLVHFEIHNRLFYDDSILFDQKVKDFFNSYAKFIVFDPDTGNNKLDWSFHFLFLIAHIQKHFLVSGVGVRQFLDLAIVVNNKYDELDWDWIKKSLAELGMYDFAERCLYLCEQWFDVHYPFEIKINPAFYESACSKIISANSGSSDHAFR